MGARLIIPGVVSLGHLPLHSCSQSPSSQHKPVPRVKRAFTLRTQGILTSTQVTAGPNAPWATHPEHSYPERTRA